MKIEVKTKESVDNPEDWEEYDFVRILIDDEEVFYVNDLDPGDCNLSQAFNDCYKLKDILTKVRNEAFELGYKQGMEDFADDFPGDAEYWIGELNEKDGK